MTMTSKEVLWQKYYEAVRANRKEEAAQLLKQIHAHPRIARPGGCSRCRKRL